MKFKRIIAAAAAAALLCTGASAMAEDYTADGKNYGSFEDGVYTFGEAAVQNGFTVAANYTGGKPDGTYRIKDGSQGSYFYLGTSNDTFNLSGYDTVELYASTNGEQVNATVAMYIGESKAAEFTRIATSAYNVQNTFTASIDPEVSKIGTVKFVVESSTGSKNIHFYNWVKFTSDPAVTVNDTGYSSWSDAKSAIESADKTDVNIVVNKDINIDTLLFDLKKDSNGSSIDKRITINAAEGKDVTITSTYTETDYFLHSDSYSKDQERNISIGTGGGALTIKTDDGFNANIAAVSKSSKLTLGSRLTLSGGAKSVMHGYDGADVIIDGANLSGLKLTSDLADVSNQHYSGKLTLKGNAELPDTAFKKNGDRCVLDVSGYTGAPVKVTVETPSAGMEIATGSADKLSYTDDTYILKDGTGEYAGKVVLALKPTEIKADLLAGNSDFTDGSKGWTDTVTAGEGQTVNITAPKWIVSNGDKKAEINAAYESSSTAITGAGPCVFGLVLTKDAIGENTISDVWFSFE